MIHRRRPKMSLEVGHKLAHYEIVAPIGKGGMEDELERPVPIQ